MNAQSKINNTVNIPFIDLKQQQQIIRENVDIRIKSVLDHGKYIMGPEITELESELSKYTQAKHSISCSSGTDALLMVLMAKGIGPGDAVFVPGFTFPATPEVVLLLGATPIFLDVNTDTFNIDPKSLIKGLKVSEEHSLKAKAIIAVDLFGQPADYNELSDIAAKHNLWILADAAQSFGATLNDQKVGKLALATATSFFPAKPLGCYGDGGAIFTDNDELAAKLKSIRIHGKGKSKYDNVRIGLNARLDTIQAAILLEKLKIFDEELKHRQDAAKFYTNELAGKCITPTLIPNSTSAWAQYTIQLPTNCKRDQLIANLKNVGIPTMVYYDKPLNKQIAYQNSPCEPKHLPISTQLSETVLSLPICGYITEKTQIYITSEVKKWI